MNNIYIKLYDTDEYLVHHGIKGQRWGIRRYQNSDGSLTTAGRARYGVRSIGKSPGEITRMINKDIKKRKAKQAEKVAKAKVKQEKKAAEKERQRRAELDRQMKTGPGAARKALDLSDEDLTRETERYRKAADYMDQRARVDDKIDRYLSKEKSFSDKVVGGFETASKIAGSMSKIYESYNKMFGNNSSMSEFDQANLELKKLTIIERKRKLGLKDTEAADLILKGQKATSVNKVVNQSNKKLSELDKASNTDAERIASALAEILDGKSKR